MKLSKQQSDYLLTSSRFESLQSLFQVRCNEKNLEEMFKLDFEEALKIEQQLGIETGFFEAKRELYYAENMLIEWLFESMRDSPWYQKNKIHLEFLRRHYWVSKPIRAFIIAVASKNFESETENVNQEQLVGYQA